jgi:hypothetical protein
MGNVRGGQISAGDKKKIADLKRKAKQTAVYRGGKRLNQSELDSRKADLQRQIANIQTRGGSEAYSYRPRFFGRPTRDIRTPSVTDTNINDLIVSNLGQQGGLRDTSPIIDRTPIVRSPLPPINMPVAAPRNRNYSLPAPVPRLQDFNSRIPSIFSQYVPGGDVVYKQGFAQRSDELSPSLMDTLRANTGAFTDNIRLPGGLEIRRAAPRYNAPSDTVTNPYIGGQQTFTPPDTKFGFDFSLPTATDTTPTTVSRPPSPYSTVGQFGEGLLTALADAGATYNPPYGVFDVRVAPFRNPKFTETLQEKIAASRQKYPYIRAQVDPRLTDPSTVFGGINLKASATGREYSPSGNPMGLLFAPEIQRRFGPAISSALDGKSYTLY